jgi:DNA-binding NtrC family response regulator
MRYSRDVHKSRVLVVDDDPAIRKVVADRVRALGHVVETAVDGEEALVRADSFEPDLVLVDMMMPRLDGFGVLEKLGARDRVPEIVMITAHGTIERAVEAIRRGAADFIPKPFDGGHLDHVVTRVLDTAGLRQRVERLESELSGRHSLVTGGSKAMREVVAIAERAATSASTVLLLGESGSGKEVLARHIHQASPRRDGPFVAVSCAMLGPNLAESELFGYEKGAFTGAHKSKPGRIEMASGGTLFLDELGELPADVQAKLLRVLQERQFERVGGTKTLDADIRIIAATNADLRASIDAGAFREDLYYRLNVISIRIPPLRERLDDLDALVDHALAKCALAVSKPGATLSPAARAALRAYVWPGNVRELHNVIERAVVLAEGSVIEPHDLPEELVDCASPEPRPPDPDEPPSAEGDGEILPFREAEVRAKREIILRALARTGGHQTRAAELLGTTQPYLARLMKSLKIRGR